jgi:hypothetical protein
VLFFVESGFSRIPRRSGGGLTSLPLPRGLLVLDGAGHIFEGVQHGRPQGAPALGERQLAPTVTARRLALRPKSI